MGALFGYSFSVIGLILSNFVLVTLLTTMHSYFIDTHTHLFSEEFSDDIDEVIRQAEEAAVKRFILPAIDSSTYSAMMGVANRFPHSCFSAIGLHPTSVGKTYKEELNFVRERLTQEQFIAIGEVGMDCYWSTEFIEQQRYVFKEQLQLALAYQLPVIIHSRESFREIMNILNDFKGKGLTGVFHSFSGGLDDYEEVKSFGGFKVGIGGVLTFKNSHLPEVVKGMELADIVLETDSPYLAPVPYRGKRNQSAYIPLVAQRLAEVKGLALTEVMNTTTQNAVQLFKLV